MQKKTPKKTVKKIHKKVDRTKTDLDLILRNAHFLRPSGQSFWDFLTFENIPFTKKHFPFLSPHTKPKIKKIFDFSEYMKIGSRGEALSYLYDGFGKSFNYVGPVLDSELKHGFNDHTDRHTLWVSQTGVELLQRAGVSYDGKGQYDSNTEVLMTLIGMTHDLGNFFSRKEHSTYSAWLLTRLFSNFEKHKDEFDAVLHAVLFHEEPILIDLNLEISNGTPLQWALVAADKMHVGRDRIGGRSFQSGIENGALEDDIHIVLNALIVRSAWYLGVRSFVWHLDFSIDQLEEKFESFTTGNKRLYLPKFFQNVFIKKGIVYRESFVKLFNEIYIHRMKMAAKCVFLLFPHINEFRVELSDNDTRAKVGSAKMTVFVIRRKQLF
ncbi:MAG: hypothetical protein H6772_03865 [Pseudomonadales bacterium]|nr:hypothetical protein [Pseudomonadales bacterium]